MQVDIMFWSAPNAPAVTHYPTVILALHIFIYPIQTNYNMTDRCPSPQVS